MHGNNNNWDYKTRNLTYNCQIVLQMKKVKTHNLQLQLAMQLIMHFFQIKQIWNKKLMKKYKE
jgi:hypothetical protein